MIAAMPRPPLLGLIPAAGRAARLGTLPCSKEVLPLGAPAGDPPRAPVAADALLAALRRAGAERAFVVLRQGKWDVPAFLGGGPEGGPRLAYLVTDGTPGVPWSCDLAYPFVRDARVAFGFPDIRFEPDDALERLLAVLEPPCDAVLGLFPCREPARSDMVRTDSDGRVLELQIKPARTELTRSWILAVWSPAFTEFLHDFVAAARDDGPEIHLGEVFRAALAAGLELRSVDFGDGSFTDIGTPAGLARALREG